MSQERTAQGFTFTCDCCGCKRAPPSKRRSNGAKLPAPDAWVEAEKAGWKLCSVVHKETPSIIDYEHRCGECA